MLIGVRAEQFDDVAIAQTFVLQPLIFLGGVFYSASLLPEPFETLTHFNPVYYMIALVRYGFLGYAEANMALSLFFLTLATAALFAVNLRLFSAATSCAPNYRRTRTTTRFETPTPCTEARSRSVLRGLPTRVRPKRRHPRRSRAARSWRRCRRLKRIVLTRKPLAVPAGLQQRLRRSLALLGRNLRAQLHAPPGRTLRVRRPQAHRAACSFLRALVGLWSPGRAESRCTGCQDAAGSPSPRG